MSAFPKDAQPYYERIPRIANLALARETWNRNALI